MSQLPSWLDQYPNAQREALTVHLNEISRRGLSDLAHSVVAERAGVGRSSVVAAVATACARRHLTVWPREGEASVIRLKAMRKP